MKMSVMREERKKSIQSCDDDSQPALCVQWRALVADAVQSAATAEAIAVNDDDDDAGMEKKSEKTMKGCSPLAEWMTMACTIPHRRRADDITATILTRQHRC